ncbi:flagellar biosynthesis protein FlhA [Capsulimonas corticalis]|uniref:Flagellar biosynthesis protein FlhA n=1 Tax=Capsulimonas corticalis TaxID=2219043 RepID=A0A402CQD6_9BACT|nr:flagellar biosynthesis protein FlhA [Capsulimonas corticalis]BDI32699.1 flagellar biosynthesis protein FlhA [Capsulimonas corticalis]
MAVTTGVQSQGTGGAPSGIMGFFAKAAQQTDIAMALALIGMIAMLILPLPEALLDLGLVLNLAGAVLILLTSLYTTEPLQFSVFPALLLVTTLFRLALEVSAMKLIIGTGSAGHVIKTFGEVVIGGNYVVGIIVFLLLVVVQFVVITAGAGRVAEVAARFTLDAMPGKQMAIDADLNAGVITQDQARDRRKAVGQEADFYGAMDGANKFVRGDAIAAIVIIVLNIIGGFAMGLSKGEDVVQVLQKYTILTVGEGLVAQIPALLISTSAGLMVTRAASDTAMGGDIARQLFTSPRPLIIAGCLVLLFIPFGFPAPQTLLVAGILGGTGFMLIANEKKAVAVAHENAIAAAAPKPLAATTPQSLLPLLNVDVLELNFGYGLLGLVDQAAGGDLLDRITMIRQKTALELGLVIPTVRIRDDLHLRSNDYTIKLKGASVASGTVHPSSIMLIDPGVVIDPIVDGIPTREPAFGVPAQWVPKAMRDRAEMAGYTVVDPSSVITTHLAEVIKSYAAEIITRQDSQALIEHIRQANSAVVEELIPALMSVGEVQKVLQHLLRERISIRDMVTILETLADNASKTKDMDMLGEWVRAALARSICRQYVDESSGTLHALTLDPQLEQTLMEAVVPGSPALSLEPSVAREFLRSLGQHVERMAALGYQQPLLICMAALRLPLRRLTERSLPQLVILSYHEIVPNTDVRAVGSVTGTEHA